MKDVEKLIKDLTDIFNEYNRNHMNKREMLNHYFGVMQEMYSSLSGMLIDTLMKMNNYIDFQDDWEGEKPVIRDSSITSIRRDELTNYLYINLNNGETIMDCDLSLDELYEINRVLD